MENRRGRLLKLYEMGEIDDEYFIRESNKLKAEMAKVHVLDSFSRSIETGPVATDLKLACRRIEDWVLNAEGDDFILLLDAMQVEVHAEKGRGELKGMIPEYAPRKSHADVRPVVVSRGSGKSSTYYWELPLPVFEFASMPSARIRRPAN